MKREFTVCDTTIETLKGEILTHIDIADDEIMLTAKSGRKVRFRHYQECCEYVVIYSINGDIHKLLGKIIVEATEETDSENNPPEDAVSFTWTTHTFRVDEHTAIVKWIGESNGYYSEDVTIEDVLANTEA